MRDEQVNALAQACRAGAMTEAEMLAIIERHHRHEKEFICRYTQSLVCGFRSDPYVGPGAPLTFDDAPDQSEALAHPAA